MIPSTIKYIIMVKNWDLGDPIVVSIMRMEWRGSAWSKNRINYW